MDDVARKDARVGLIGYGLAGEAFHAPLIASTPGLELSAIVTSRSGRAAAAAARYPRARVVPTVDELWGLDVDLVVVATPNDSHVPLARAALERDLAVVVDKPVAPGARAARELDALARARGLLLTVFQNRRWDGDFLTVRDAVLSGLLGDVRRFESRFERWSPVATGGWRETAAPEMAGGLLWDLGAHLVDQAVQLFGPVASVYAECDVRRDGVEADDDSFVALTHVGGVRSHLWMSAVAAHENPRFRVVGSKAALVTWGLDPQEDALRAGRVPVGDGLADDGSLWGVAETPATADVVAGPERSTRPVRAGDYPAFYAGVARALHEGVPAPVSVTDAAAVLDVLETARRAAQQGEVLAVAAS